MSDYNPNQFDDDAPNPWTVLKRDVDAVKNAMDDGKHLTEASRERIRARLSSPNVAGVEATYEIRRGDNDPTQILKDIKVLSDAETIAQYLAETQNCAWYVVEHKVTHQTVAAFGV